MTELRAILHHLAQHPDRRSVLATLVAVSGSSYRRPGARLLLTSEGKRIGSISGGCLEEDVLARAQRVLDGGQPEIVTYDTTSENDLVWGVGLGCHGIVHVLLERLEGFPRWAAMLDRNLANHAPTSLAITWRSPDSAQLGTKLADETGSAPPNTDAFLETIPPPTWLFIFGAGDDARPLVRFAVELGWRVTVADPRNSYATTDRFPSAAIAVAPASELVASTNPPPDAVAVVMTHHYVHDRPILRDLLARKLAYVGLLGPKKRAERLIDDLAREGPPISSEARESLHAPVGLDLGADTPEEVALSIIAEIKAVLSRRDARPLRERQKPIHHE